MNVPVRLSLSLLAVLSIGCHPSLRKRAALSAPVIGCVADEITVTELAGRRSWTATCEGASYVCGDTGDRVECIARRATAREVAEEERTISEAVERLVSHGQVAFRGRVDSGSTKLVFLSTPGVDPTRVWLVVTMQGDGSHGSCQSSLSVNGARHPLSLEQHDYEVRSEKLRFVLSLDTVRALSSSTEAELDICGASWPISGSSRRVIAELVSRIDAHVSQNPPVIQPDTAVAPGTD